MKSCFFNGHRETSEEVFPSIRAAIECLIKQQQVYDYYVGMYGNFDRLAREALSQLKKQYPNIRLYLVLPYHPADRPTATPPGFDGTFLPDGMETVSRRYAIIKANRKMIDTCNYLIAYVTHSVSNAQNLLEYALQRQKRGLIQVINLGEGERR